MRNSEHWGRRAPRIPRPFTARPRGFTLIELVVSVVILSVTIVAMLRFGGLFARANSDTTARAVASRLASRRLEVIRMTPNYASIDGYAESNVAISGYPGFTRTTVVARTGTGLTTEIADYKTVTTTVTSQRLARGISKTTAISRF